MSRYREVSAEIRAIFHRYTDLVEPISIDEAYLDVTDNKLGIETGTEVARRIKADILRETSLTASAGVSYNKFLAKIASDWRKPDGLCTQRAQLLQLRLDNHRIGGDRQHGDQHQRIAPPFAPLDQMESPFEEQDARAAERRRDTQRPHP